MNWTALAEVVLAVLITQMDVLRRLLGTEQLTGEQWVLALVPAIALFFLWELGKLVARRGAEPASQPIPPRSPPPDAAARRPDTQRGEDAASSPPRLRASGASAPDRRASRRRYSPAGSGLTCTPMDTSSSTG